MADLDNQMETLEDESRTTLRGDPIPEEPPIGYNRKFRFDDPAGIQEERYRPEDQLNILDTPVDMDRDTPLLSRAEKIQREAMDIETEAFKQPEIEEQENVRKYADAEAELIKQEEKYLERAQPKFQFLKGNLGPDGKYDTVIYQRFNSAGDVSYEKIYENISMEEANFEVKNRNAFFDDKGRDYKYSPEEDTPIIPRMVEGGDTPGVKYLGRGAINLSKGIVDPVVQVTGLGVVGINAVAEKLATSGKIRVPFTDALNIDRIELNFPGLVEPLLSSENNEKLNVFLDSRNDFGMKLSALSITDQLVLAAHESTKDLTFLSSSNNFENSEVVTDYSPDELLDVINAKDAGSLRNFINYAARDAGSLMLFRGITGTTRRQALRFFNELRVDAAEDLIKHNKELIAAGKKPVLIGDDAKLSAVELARKESMIPQLTARAKLIFKSKNDKSFKGAEDRAEGWLGKLKRNMLFVEGSDKKVTSILYGSEFGGSYASAYAEGAYGIDRENPWNMGIQALAAIKGDVILSFGIRNFQKPVDKSLRVLELSADGVKSLFLAKGPGGVNFIGKLRRYIETGGVDGKDLRAVKIPDGKGGERPLTEKEIRNVFNFVDAAQGSATQQAAILEQINWFGQTKDMLIAEGIPENVVNPLLADALKLSYLQDGTKFMLDTTNLGFRTRQARKIKGNFQWIKHYSEVLSRQNELVENLVSKFDEIKTNYGVSKPEEFSELENLVMGKIYADNEDLNEFSAIMADYGVELLNQITTGSLKLKSHQIVDLQTDITQTMEILKGGANGALSKDTKVVDAAKDLLHNNIVSKIGKKNLDRIAAVPYEEIQKHVSIMQTSLARLDQELDELSSTKLPKVEVDGRTAPNIASGASIEKQRSVVSENWAALIHRKSRELSEEASERFSVIDKNGNPVQINALDLVGDLWTLARSINPTEVFAGMQNEKVIKNVLNRTYSDTAQSINSKIIKSIAENEGIQAASIRKNIRESTANFMGIPSSSVENIDILLYFSQHKDFYVNRMGVDSESLGMVLGMGLDEFQNLSVGVSRRLNDSSISPADNAYLKQSSSILRDFEKGALEQMAPGQSKKLMDAKGWYTKNAVGFRHQNNHVPNVYIYKGADTREIGNITGAYHELDPTQWLGKLVKDHMNLETDGAGELIKTLQAMFPKVTNKNGKSEPSTDFTFALELVKRELGLQMQRASKEKALEEVGSASQQDVLKFLNNPKPLNVVSNEFDQFVIDLDKLTGGRISFNALQKNNASRKKSIELMQKNANEFKVAGEALQAATTEVKNGLEQMDRAVKLLSEDASEAGQQFKGVIKLLETKPAEFFEYVSTNPNELADLKKYAISKFNMSEEKFNGIIARQLARGLTKKVRRVTIYDMKKNEFNPSPVYSGVVDEAVMRTQGMPENRLNTSELLNLLDDPVTVKLFKEYMPADLNKLKAILYGDNLSKGPVRTGLNTSADRSPSIDTAGLSSRGNALAQERTGVRYQIAEMMLAVFLRSEIDAVAALMLNPQATNIMTDLIVKGKVPPSRWRINPANKTGLWLPDFIAQANYMYIDDVNLELENNSSAERMGNQMEALSVTP